MQAVVENMEPISMDPRAYRFFPKKQQEKIGFNKANGARIYFYGQIEHDDFEKKKLDQFKKFLSTKEYDQEYYNEKLLLLYLHFSGYKPDNAFQEMIKHQDFRYKYIRRKEHPHQRIISLESDEKVRKLLSTGFFYVCGRDRFFRPTMVFNLPRSDMKDVEAVLRGIVFVQEEVIEKMFLPGQVECWNIIFDLGGMGITDVPVNSLKNVLQLISANYGGRLYKLWMLNCPGTIYFSWKVVKNFLDAVTVDKILIVKKNTDDSLWKVYDKSQIEKKYGGTQPDRTEFLPFLIPRAAPDEERLISEEKYKQMLDSGILKDNIIDPKYREAPISEQPVEQKVEAVIQEKKQVIEKEEEKAEPVGKEEQKAKESVVTQEKSEEKVDEKKEAKKEENVEEKAVEEKDKEPTIAENATEQPSKQ